MTAPNELGVNTHVSGAGSIYWNQGNQYSGAPGAAGPGGTMSVNSAALSIIVSAGIAYIVLGFVFRKKG